LFYFVTNLQDCQVGGDDCWTRTYLADTGKGCIEDRSITEKYIAVLYWSLTTMSTIGYGDIIPRTSTERAFVTISMITGACFFAYGLTNVCALIFNHNKHKARFEATTDELNEYIDRRGFTHQFGIALTRALWYQHSSSTLEESNRVHDEMLGGFSPDLQRKAYLHLAKSVFCHYHPPLLVQDNTMLVELFRHAQGVIFPPHELVWQAGSENCSPFDSIYFVVKGAVSAVTNEHAHNQDVQELLPGSSFGDMQVLLCGTAGVQRTKFYCKKHCDIYTISRTAVQKIMIDNLPFLQACIEQLAGRSVDYILHTEMKTMARDNKLKSRKGLVKQMDAQSSITEAEMFMQFPLVDSVESIQEEIMDAQQALLKLHERLFQARTLRQVHTDKRQRRHSRGPSDEPYRPSTADNDVEPISDNN